MLRTVKLLALVAMFLVALSSSAQVTTSALSGVVTDENQQAMIGATVTTRASPPEINYSAISNSYNCVSVDNSKDISRENQPQVRNVAGNSRIITESNVCLISFIILVSVVFIVALCNGNNIRIKYDGAGIDFEIFSKKEKRE